MSLLTLRRSSVAILTTLAAGCGGGGDSGGTAPPTPGFTVALSSTTLSVDQGASGSITATIGRTGGHSVSISLTAEGVPAGVTATFTPSDISTSTTLATLNVSVALTVAPGAYSFTVRGQSASGDPRTATVSLTVTPRPAIAIALSATTGSAVQGANATYAATVTRTNFTGTVTVAVTGAPAGATPAVVANNDVHTVTVTVGPTTAPGTYTLTTTASGTGLTAVSANYTLTVTLAPPSIFLSASPTALSLTTGGASLSSTLTITKINFTGTVVVAVQSGLPANTSAVINPTGPTQASSATVTFAANASAIPGTYNVVIQGAGFQATAGTATIALTIAAPPPSVALSANPATLSLAQNTSGSATINIARTNFTGAVTLAATGQPTGVTPTFTTSPTTGPSATLTLAVGANVQTGTYQITVTGSGTGLANVTTTVALTVTLAGSGSNIGYTFCGGLTVVPIWFAYQSGTSGPWTAVPAGPNNTYQINVSGVGGVAWVSQASPNNFNLNLHYGTVADLTAQGGSLCNNAGPFKMVNGTVSGFGAGNADFVTLAIGSAFALPGPTFAMPNFSITGVPNGLRDLVATRSTFSIADPANPLTLNKMLIRRGINPPNLGSVDTVDFNGAEAFDPDTKQITVSGATGGEFVTASNTFITNTQSFGSLGFLTLAAGTLYNVFTVPSAKTVAGDIQAISVNASTTSGSLVSTMRSVAAAFRDPANQTITLGPLLSQPTVSVVSTAPYVRLRTQLLRQAEYPNSWSTIYSQGATSTIRTGAITMTPGYIGSATSFDVTVPDFTGVAGWQSTWGLLTGANTIWNTTAIGWISGTGGLTDGSIFRTAQRGGQLTP